MIMLMLRVLFLQEINKNRLACKWIMTAAEIKTKWPGGDEANRLTGTESTVWPGLKLHIVQFQAAGTGSVEEPGGVSSTPVTDERFYNKSNTKTIQKSLFPLWLRQHQSKIIWPCFHLELLHWAEDSSRNGKKMVERGGVGGWQRLCSQQKSIRSIVWE